MDAFLSANPTLVLLLGFALLVLATLLSPLFFYVYHWRQVRQAEVQAVLARAEMDAALKQDMLQRGLSADQIQQVIQASSGSQRPSREFTEALTGLINEAKAAKAAIHAEIPPEDAKRWADFGRRWGAFGQRFARRWGGQTPGCRTS